MSVEMLTKLSRHMEWADATLWGALRSHADAFADDFVVESVVHLHMVQQASAKLTGHPRRHVDGPSFEGNDRTEGTCRHRGPAA